MESHKQPDTDLPLSGKRKIEPQYDYWRRTGQWEQMNKKRLYNKDVYIYNKKVEEKCRCEETFGHQFYRRHRLDCFFRYQNSL